MSVVNDVLSVARSLLGLGETPPGSNDNIVVQWYNRVVDKIGRGAWCEMTATYCYWLGGAKALKKGRAYTVWGANDYRAGYAGSKWFWGTSGIQPGDQVYFDWHRSKGNTAYIDHTGIVEKVFADGTFYSLEGNLGDRMQRVHRDSTYVVGYGRPDWSRVGGTKPPASAVPNLPKPKPSGVDRSKTAKFQRLLEVSVDGLWGKDTDDMALRMRTAARAHCGWPRNVAKAFNERLVQKVVDTTADNIWGPNTQRAMVKWIRDFQSMMGIQVDGQWGPATDNAFLALRKANHNKF